MIGDGDELSFADTGYELRNGTNKFAGLRAPLETRLHLDVLLDEAHLQDLSMAAGMLPINGAVMNCSEMHRSFL